MGDNRDNRDYRDDGGIGMKGFYKFVQTWWPWLMDVALVVLVVLLLCSCSTAKTVARVTVKDSVEVRYRTVQRDSVVVRDSVRWVTRTAIRDSVVVRVDAGTGDVIGKDSWHWRDTDNDKERFADVRKTMNNSDSLTYTATLRKDSVVTPLKQEKASEGRKSGITWFLWGMGCGLLISAMWKYRKRIIRMLKII